MFALLVTLALPLSLAQDTTISTNPTFNLRAYPYGNGTLSGPYNIDTIRGNALLVASWKNVPVLEVANYYASSVAHFFINEDFNLIYSQASPISIPSELAQPLTTGTDVVGTKGFSLAHATDSTYEQLVWQPESGAEFGAWYTCWQDGNIYGPSLYYRNADGTTPEGCVDVELRPECTPTYSVSSTTVVDQVCYVNLGEICPSLPKNVSCTGGR